MRKQLLLALLVLMASPFVLLSQAQAVSLSYQFVADVPLQKGPRNIRFSESGEHLSIEYSSVCDHFLAVYTHAAGKDLHLTSLPNASGTWIENDVIVVRIPKTRGKSVLLPPYGEMLEARERISAEPSSASAVDRFAVAAWAYCEDSSFQVISIAGVPVFETLDQLSAATHEYFGHRPADRQGVTNKAVSKAIQSLAAASRVYFVDEWGRRARGTHGRESLPRLFMVEGETKQEVTAPGLQGVYSFTFDGLKKRVCALVGSNELIYDGVTGERRLFPVFDPDTRIDMRHYLVPGEDYLLVRMAIVDKKGYNYLDEWLELWTLDGERVATIPTSLEGGGRPVEIDHRIALSHQLLTIHLTADLPDGTVKNVLRIFRAVRSP